MLRKRPLWVLPAAALLVDLSWVYVTEQVGAISCVVALLACAAFFALWRVRRIFVGLLAVNTALLLAYFWSLGETHHVVVQVSRGEISATVDGDTTVQPVDLAGTRV